MSTEISVDAEGLDPTELRGAFPADLHERFRNARKGLRPRIRHAKIISRGSAGIRSKDGRMYWASALFTRMTVMADSILALVPQDERKDRWDAASICALTRNLAECYLWMFFLSFDEVSDEAHEARILMMYAHDNRGRERINEEAGGPAALAEYFRRVRVAIAERLGENPYFASLPESRRKEIIKGDRTPFVQDELLERTRLERAEFRVNYRILSAQTHSSPVAFYEMLTSGGGSGVAHDQEVRYMGLALEFANRVIDLAVADMLLMHPYAERRGRMLSEKDVRSGKHYDFPIPD